VVNPRTAPYYDYYLRTAVRLSQSLGVELVPAFVDNAGEIERAIESFALGSKGGLVVPPDISNVTHRDLIIALADRHRVPAVYNNRVFVADGGLMSYGVNFVDMCRQAAPYVDRILRGDKPADLPVQAAIKFETILNVKTAKALGLTVPPGLLLAADEVIE
jgi:putative ABC transport system substrate-binding protein